jgi:hypothetical protein
MLVIGFGTNEQWHSKLIRWISGSTWSHVWVEDLLWNHQVVLHATTQGIIVEPYLHVLDRYPTYERYRVVDLVDLRLGLRRMIGDLGERYDYSIIWNGLLLGLWKLTHLSWLYKLTITNASKSSCSDWVINVLHQAGFFTSASLFPISKVKKLQTELGLPPSGVFEPDTTPPSTIHKICVQAPDCFELLPPVPLR